MTDRNDPSIRLLSKNGETAFINIPYRGATNPKIVPPIEFDLEENEYTEGTILDPNTKQRVACKVYPRKGKPFITLDNGRGTGWTPDIIETDPKKMLRTLSDLYGFQMS